MLASGGKILALGKVYHDETNLPVGPSLKGSGRPLDPLYVNEDWIIDKVNNKVSGASKEWVLEQNFQPSGDYVSADDFNKYKNEVSSAFSATSAWANDTFVTNNTFNTYSADIHNELEQKFYTSAFSASFSSAFNQEFNTYIQSATSGWDHKEYSAGPGIKIEDHIVSLEPSAVPFDRDYYTKDQTSGAYQLSEAFNKYKEWSETSAWAEQTFIPQTASTNWDLDKYSGFDGIKVDGHWIGISADYVKPEDLLPYAKTEALSAIPTLKSSDLSVAITSATSAGHVEYDLKVDKMPEIHISGERGISAQDLGDGNWLIGASADNLAYLYGSFRKNNSETVTSGDIIKFIGTQKDITIDSDGYITVPNSVDKLTVCLNATIDNNIPEPDPHNYMLNQFVLSAVGGDALLTTHDYYPSEVGAADANIATTLQHVPGRKYCVVYLGSDALQKANLDVNLSMIEEVISLSDNSGQATPYNGEPPIYVLNQNISLKYDEDFFTLKSKTESGIQKQYLTLAQTSSGGQVSPVDPEVFNKLLNSVNRRIVETVPIGIVNQTDNQGDGDFRTYLFRPMIEFDMKPGTTARIRTYQKDSNTKVQVAVYEVTDEDTGTLQLIWVSEDKLLDKDKGEHVLGTHSSCEWTMTIYPEKLYYVLVKTRGGHVGLVGLANGIGHDTGMCDVAYYKTGQGDVEWSVNNRYTSITSLGSDGQPANFKPYVGFRNP